MKKLKPAREVTSRQIAFSGLETNLQRSVPVEMPVSILYGNVPYAVMMATPVDLEDFAIGFSLTEGVIADSAEILGIEIRQQLHSVEVTIKLAAHRMSQHLARKRTMSGRTGCGVCGIEDAENLIVSKPARSAAERELDAIELASIETALHALDHHQPLNDLTHAVHAAAWFDRAGEFVTLREDLGRHNALDKLIGSLLRAKINPADGFLVITSRCSFEMVEKAACFGASTLVAISAPTSLAIERAQALGITLLAIARHDALTQFTGAALCDTRAKKEICL